MRWVGGRASEGHPAGPRAQRLRPQPSSLGGSHLQVWPLQVWRQIYN